MWVRSKMLIWRKTQLRGFLYISTILEFNISEQNESIWNYQNHFCLNLMVVQITSNYIEFYLVE